MLISTFFKEQALLNNHTFTNSSELESIALDKLEPYTFPLNVGVQKYIDAYGFDFIF